MYVMSEALGRYRRRAAGSIHGGVHTRSTSFRTTPGGTIWSIASSVSASSLASAPASTSSRWSIVLGPMMAEVTAGWASTNAFAMWVSDRPALSATAARFSTASSLRWFSGSDTSNRAATALVPGRHLAIRESEGGAWSRRYFPVSHPPASGLHAITPMPYRWHTGSTS